MDAMTSNFVGNRLFLRQFINPFGTLDSFAY
ncbi:hypothetical protein F01_420898 [Burkholderia cenocepacia]|nr:hypothetical protein F01_420898 [Burkholderia cenocepacia]